ncbi:hypothetical protein [Neisseria elongata]|uniref:hypothetical protein n=1 Tax=Neisseria elongata TaxID=495 RepID=UPI00131CB880|nr:hypothetical protein [Neisseria elongata]
MPKKQANLKHPHHNGKYLFQTACTNRAGDKTHSRCLPPCAANVDKQDKPFKRRPKNKMPKKQANLKHPHHNGRHLFQTA